MIGYNKGTNDGNEIYYIYYLNRTPEGTVYTVRFNKRPVNRIYSQIHTEYQSIWNSIRFVFIKSVH